MDYNAEQYFGIVTENKVNYLNSRGARLLEDDDNYFHELGFKCGLEIHQQLGTEKKLFCRCNAVLHGDKPSAEILRHMRPTLSELGEYDGTALMEFKTKKNVIYQLYDDTVCTYEMDDTPPFPLNQQALEIALEIGLLLDCSIVDEIHISRKQYLDGSIPAGFQRTGIVGVGGDVKYQNRKIRIIQLGLEEDACREICDVRHTIVYKTDRLSIPLVEVVTYPDMRTPVESAEVAEVIGRLLRSTGKVRRGLGSVRQDVNVSITGGTRVEIKGVPKLQYIAAATASEAKRQKALLDIRDELRSRGISEGNFKSDFRDVTELFKNTKCAPFNNIIKNEGKIHGIILRLFEGILNKTTQPGKTFGDEIAGRVRVIACLDEMPNIVYSNHFKEFGLELGEIDQLGKLFDATSTDTIVLVWGKEDDVKTAIEEIRIRAIEATKGVPSETRQLLSDLTNTFERILPGPDRMYPDTDSPPTPINEQRLARIRKIVPEHIWNREKRLVKLGLPDVLMRSLAISRYIGLFDEIIKNLGMKPVLVAATLLEKFKWLRRKGKDVTSISEEKIYQLFRKLKENRFSKEAVPMILEFLADNPEKTMEEAIPILDLYPISIEELEIIVENILDRFPDRAERELSFKFIMGEVMKFARNRIDGKLVKEVVFLKLGKSNSLPE